MSFPVLQPIKFISFQNLANKNRGEDVELRQPLVDLLPLGFCLFETKRFSPFTPELSS